MSNLVRFPGLGLVLEVNRVAFTIFGIDVYWYGVLIGIGLLLGVAFAFTQTKRVGIDADRMVDVIIVGFVCAIVCGRLYYVIFSGESYPTFFSVIDLRSGGIAIYGGIIGAVAGAVAACRWRKVPIWPQLDLTAMGFLIGQAIGRWGNFFNQEAFGSNTNLPWGMISPSTTAYLRNNEAQLIEKGIFVDPNLPVHPTFLYESLWCALGFLLLYLYRKKRRFNGEIFLFYVMWYGFGRFFIEGLRTDPLMIGGMRVSQLLAALSVVAAVAVWIVARRKTAGKPLVVPEIPPHTARVKLETADGPTEVVISWPADERPPDREQREQLARMVLQKGNEATGETEAEAGAPPADTEDGDGCAEAVPEAAAEALPEDESGENAPQGAVDGDTDVAEEAETVTEEETDGGKDH